MTLLTDFCLQETSYLQVCFVLQGATKDMWRTKNIDFYIQWYNRLSSFVATEICVVSIIISYFTVKQNDFNSEQLLLLMRFCF